MQSKPEFWSLEDLLAGQLGRTALLATPSVSKEAAKSLPFELGSSFDILPTDLDTLIIIGGGTLIDTAKVWRVRHAPSARLIAIPSLWGSGAEVSPVAVLNRQGKKDIYIGDEYMPDIRCLWPELSQTVPDHMIPYACGDALSHALEGFFSPLADSYVQKDLSEVMRKMLVVSPCNDPRWFELSARACYGQAQASVGLVHGIAHVLEGYLQAAFPDEGWGHARLCSLFLWPVFEFNRQNSSKWDRLIDQYGLDGAEILELIQSLYDSDSYTQALGALDRHWMEILRDPCTRTNSTLVRPASKRFFMERAFL